MLHRKISFLRILSVELEDLNEDIKILIEQSKKKHSNDEISNYVFFENLAVLKNELFGVEGFIKDVKTTDPNEYDTLEDLMIGLMKKLEERVQEKGLAHAVLVMVDRKMKKVIGYIHSK